MKEAPLTLSSMADPISHKKLQSSHQDLHSTPLLKPFSRTKSFSLFFCKFVFFLLFLVAILLFTSQAPNFIHQTIFIKFLELFHPLFIGLALCYALFSPRNVDEVGFDAPCNGEDPQSSIFSRIFDVSPIFYEKNECQNWKFQYYSGESMVGGTDRKTDISELSQNELLNSENGFQMSFENDEIEVIQAWNSMDVTSKENYAGDDIDEPGYKTLGLPVGSSNSRIMNLGGSQFGIGSTSVYSSNGSSSVCEKDFAHMDPLNSEDSVYETVTGALTSEVPWPSRCGRKEMREREGSVVCHPTHFKPLSVDETQFESLKLSKKVHCIAEELEEKKSFSTSYPPITESPLATVNGETRLNAFHLRRYGSGPLFQKDSSGNRREDSLSSKENVQSSSKSDKKPATTFKASSRGRSVRIVRGVAEAMKGGETGKNYIGIINLKAAEVPIGLNKENFGIESDTPNSTIAKDSESKMGSFRASLGEDVVTDALSEAGHDPYEVDKKAGEFIAKFREQIRLQKVASVERSRKMKHIGNRSSSPR